MYVACQLGPAGVPEQRARVLDLAGAGEAAAGGGQDERDRDAPQHRQLNRRFVNGSMATSLSATKDRWDVLVVAAPKAELDAHGTPPPADLVDRMFGPVSHSNDPSSGGLGISSTTLISSLGRRVWVAPAGHGHDLCAWDTPS